MTDAKPIPLHGTKHTDEQDRIRKELHERLDEVFLELRKLGVAGFAERYAQAYTTDDIVEIGKILDELETEL